LTLEPPHALGTEPEYPFLEVPLEVRADLHKSGSVVGGKLEPGRVCLTSSMAESLDLEHG
jgi:hypothetical protein